MDSERGVWFPPLPFDGGTPTKRVGGMGLAAAEASSASIRVSTSSIATSTFSGLRSRRTVDQCYGGEAVRGGKLTGMNYAATPVHIIEAQQNLLRNLLADGHGYTLVLMPLDQTKKIFSKDLKDHTDVGAVGSFVPEMIQE